MESDSITVRIRGECSTLYGDVGNLMRGLAAFMKRLGVMKSRHEDFFSRNQLQVQIQGNLEVQVRLLLQPLSDVDSETDSDASSDTGSDIEEAVGEGGFIKSRPAIPMKMVFRMIILAPNVLSIRSPKQPQSPSMPVAVP